MDHALTGVIQVFSGPQSADAAKITHAIRQELLNVIFRTGKTNKLVQSVTLKTVLHDQRCDEGPLISDEPCFVIASVSCNFDTGLLRGGQNAMRIGLKIRGVLVTEFNCDPRAVDVQVQLTGDHGFVSRGLQAGVLVRE